MQGARPQPGHQHVACGRLADDQRQVLILIVVAVEQGQLLTAVRRIVGLVEVERDRLGQAAGVLVTQALDAGVEREAQKLLQLGRRDAVFKTRERRLRSQRRIVRPLVGDELEHRIVT